MNRPDDERIKRLAEIAALAFANAHDAGQEETARVFAASYGVCQWVLGISGDAYDRTEDLIRDCDAQDAAHRKAAAN